MSQKGNSHPHHLLNIARLMAVFLFSGLIRPAFCQELIEVRVDRRFELMSIVFRLADFNEYRKGNVEDYNDAVDSAFGPFKEHAAVKMARGLRWSVGYDAIPNLAVRVKDEESFEPLRSLKDPATGLDQRWKPDSAAAFLKAMASFAKDTKADRFFESQEPLYSAALKSCKEGLASQLDLSWFERVFRKRDRDSFTLCVAPLNGGLNYGASVPNDKGGEDLFALIGTTVTPKGKIPGFTRADLPTLVHEFLHSFVNPWVDRHSPELKAAAEALAAPVTAQMSKQAYGTASTVLKEAMVRAFTIRYFRDLGREDKARSEEAGHEKRGFYWVKDLAELLGEYAGKRAVYADLEAFTPKLVSSFKIWGSGAKERYASWQEARQAHLETLFANSPRLVSMEPADGARDVDPAASVIRFVFDRPMKGGMSLMHADGVFPESAGKPAWDAEGKVLIVPVRLKPGTLYRFGLNAEDLFGFQDRGGSPLRPIVVGFRTR